MDLAIRQSIQKALEHAVAAKSSISLRRVNGDEQVVGCDLTCYENHIEATDKNGQIVEIPYSEIEAVDVADNR